VQKLSNEELNRLDRDTFKLAPKKPVIIVLDNVRSALNVGSVFRTADAFAIQAIWLCGITAIPPNREILKTALGATESVEWQHFPNTITAVAALRELNYGVYAIEQTHNSIALQDFRLNGDRNGVAVIFGHEMDGVDQEVINCCDCSIEIPQAGTKHSLNVSVCAGIVCWALYNQLKPNKT
jgi:tRNA G18 (ribose-2'-O)-methylase SpoU